MDFTGVEEAAWSGSWVGGDGCCDHRVSRIAHLFCSTLKIRWSDHLYTAFSPKEEGVRAKHTLYQWSLPEGGRHVTDNASGKCMADCGRSFGILGSCSLTSIIGRDTDDRFAEPRRYCGGCGGMFCSQDALQIDGFESRYCPTCRVTMALGSGVLGSRGGSRRGSSAFVDISRRGSVI